MSVQLIIKPQFVNGLSNSTSFINGEMLGNPFGFYGVNQASATNTPPTAYISPDINSIEETYNNTPAVNPLWSKYKSASSTDFPSVNSSNNLVIVNNSPDILSGIYTKLENCIPGQTYTVTLTLASGTPSSSLLLLTTDNSNGDLFTIGFSSTTNQFTATFTSDIADPTIFMSSQSITGSENIEISSMTVIGAETIIDIIDGENQVICDLYDDEDLPLTLSVDEFKNVAEKVQSYSKAFKLPGTHKNNRIFDFMFDITRSNNGYIFSPYRRTECILKQDGFILFQGYLRLIDVIDEEAGLSYNVNLYSEVIAFADILKDKTFNDLGFTELNHGYDRINIEASWNDSPDPGIVYTNPNTSGFRDANTTLRYPFVDWSHQFINIYQNTGFPALSNLETAFRPWINVKYLIDRIFQSSGTEFTYTSDFINSNDFKKLYMDFNWGSSPNGASPSRSGILTQAFNTSAGSYYFNAALRPFKLQETISGNNILWNNTLYRFVSDVNNLEVTVDYKLKLQNETGLPRGNTVKVSKFNSTGQNVEIFAQNDDQIGGNLTKTFEGTFSTVLETGEFILAEASSPPTDNVRISESSPLSFMTFTFSNDNSQVDELLLSIRGEMQQWQFLKGIINMFNLVTLPTESNPNNITIEPYNTIFVDNPNSKTLNWTDKIDISKMKLNPLTDLNKFTNFKFIEDDDDYAYQVYKKATQKNYGDYQFDATNEFNILNGSKEISADPFAATVIKQLDDGTSFIDFVIPTIYAENSEGVCESFENSPRIMYNNGIKEMNMFYTLFAQNGQSGTILYNFLQFSHLTAIPSMPTILSNTLDFNFGECQLFPGVGNPTVNNLYNIYWEPYFNQLYNSDTRIMIIKVNLSPADISSFNFFDNIFIKQRIFRVNKIDYKPNDLATVELILTS